MSTPFVNKNNAAAPQYAEELQRIGNDGVCPFCEENIKKYHPLPIDASRKYWLLTDNKLPYGPARHHRLFVHRKHIEHISEMSPEAWLELLEIFKDECSKRNISGGIELMRFGETRYNGGSVTHIHAHIVQSDPDSPDYKAEVGVVRRIG